MRNSTLFWNDRVRPNPCLIFLRAPANRREWRFETATVPLPFALSKTTPAPPNASSLSKPHPVLSTHLHVNLKQSVSLQFGTNSNYMNMAEANNAFFAASEVGVSLDVSVRVLWVI